MADVAEVFRFISLQGDYFGFACCWLLGWAVLWILVGIWVYRDAEARGMNAAVWLLIILLIGFIGLLIYLVVRTDRRRDRWPRPVYMLQPGSRWPPPPPPVSAQMRVCAHCGASLQPLARFCPKCGAKLQA